MIKGILFDVDGVLFDSDPYYSAAFSEVFHKYGADIPQAYFDARKGSGDKELINEIRTDFNVTEDTDIIKDKIHLAYREIIRGKLFASEGSVEFVKRAKSAGIKMALATSADRRKLFFSLEETGFDYSLFDRIVCGDEVKKAKPAPDVYIKAASELNLSNEECLVFEDAVLGIRSAVAAKSECIGVTTAFTKEVLKQSGASGVIESFRDIDSFGNIEEFQRVIEALRRS